MGVHQIDSYRKRKKSKKGIKIPAPVIYLLLLAVGLYFFIHSPFFNIKNINVIGNNLLKENQILSLSQVCTGQNLMRINKEDIIEKISVHPLIKEVNIKRKLPFTLEIIIKERKPVGLLVCQDGFIQISGEGYFLALVREIGDYELPVISGINIEQLPGPGQIIQNPGLLTALNIIKESEPSLLKNIAEINIADSKYILAYTMKGIEIRLGSSENMEKKLYNLNQILVDLINKGTMKNSIEYIDLRFSGPPVIKKKNIGS